MPRGDEAKNSNAICFPKNIEPSDYDNEFKDVGPDIHHARHHDTVHGLWTNLYIADWTVKKENELKKE